MRAASVAVGVHIIPRRRRIRKSSSAFLSLLTILRPEVPL
jgi:hypothetical protein